MGYGEPIRKEEEYDETEETQIVVSKPNRIKTAPRMAAQYEIDQSVSAQIRQVIFEVEQFSDRELEKNKTELLQKLGNFHRAIPGSTQYVSDQLRRDFYDIVDRSTSAGRGKIFRTKVLNHLYAIAAQTSVSEFELKGLSGIGAMITQQNNVRQEQRIHDTSPHTPTSIFDGIGAILGKKKEPPQNQGGY